MKPKRDERPFLQSELVGIVELLKPDAELRVSLLGPDVTDIDRIAAKHVKKKLSVYGRENITVGRYMLSDLGDMNFVTEAGDDFWLRLSGDHLDLHFDADGIQVTDHSTNGTGILHYEEDSPVGSPTKLHNEMLNIAITDIVEPHDIALLLPLKSGLALELRFSRY